jgi:hypothetical protein
MTDNRTMTDADLRACMDAEAEAIAAAETDEDDGASLPDHVKVSRPGRARSRVLQVRLNPDEYEALERIAAVRDLPVSTIARAQLLEMVRSERSRDAEAESDNVEDLFEDVSDLLAKLEESVKRRLEGRATAGPDTTTGAGT